MHHQLLPSCLWIRRSYPRIASRQSESRWGFVVMGTACPFPPDKGGRRMRRGKEVVDGNSIFLELIPGRESGRFH